MNSFILPSIILLAFFTVAVISPVEAAEEPVRSEERIPMGEPHPERGFEPCVEDTERSDRKCLPNIRINMFFVYENADFEKANSVKESLRSQKDTLNPRFQDMELDITSDERYTYVSNSFEFTPSGNSKISNLKGIINSLGVERNSAYGIVTVFNTWHHYEELYPCELIEVIEFGDKSVLDDTL